MRSVADKRITDLPASSRAKFGSRDGPRRIRRSENAFEKDLIPGGDAVFHYLPGYTTRIRRGREGEEGEEGVRREGEGMKVKKGYGERGRGRG